MLTFMPGFVTGVREADDCVRAYRALAQHWYNVCSRLILDCVGPDKDQRCICVNVRL